MAHSTTPERGGYVIWDGGARVATLLHLGDSCAIHTEEPVYDPDLAYELGRALILWSTHQRRKARDAYRTAHHLPASSIVHDHEVTP